MRTYRLMLLGTVAAGFAVMAAAPAGAGNVEKKVALSGQVSRLVGIQDDGHSTNVGHFGNDITRSLLNVDATAASENLTIGARFEWSFDANLNVNDTATQSRNTNASRGTQEARISDIFFETQYGKLSMGHGESAAMDATNSDLSGTGVAMSVAEPLSSGMGLVANTDRNGAAGTVPLVTTSVGPRVADVLVRHDGSRSNRIRYDTPRFAGFGAAVSHGHANVSEYRLDYEGELMDTELAAAVAMQNTSSSAIDFERLYLGSISAKHSSGVNLTYAYSVQNNNGNGRGNGLQQDDPTARRPVTNYAKVGYSQNFFGIGDTNLAVDWTLTADGGQNGDRAVKWGAGVVQNLEDYGVELFATYENVRFERGAADGVGYQNINAGYFGANVAF